MIERTCASCGIEESSVQSGFRKAGGDVVCGDECYGAYTVWLTRYSSTPPQGTLERWKGCSREEAIRQCEGQWAERQKYMDLFHEEQERRLALEASLAQSQEALERLAPLWADYSEDVEVANCIVRAHPEDADAIRNHMNTLYAEIERVDEYVGRLRVERDTMNEQVKHVRKSIIALLHSIDSMEADASD